MASPVSEEAMIQRRDELNSRLNDLNEEQTQIKRELHAISLYLNTIKGELPQAEQPPGPKPESKPRRASTGPRAPRGKRRGEILDILGREPDGYTLDQILESMEVTTGQEKKAIYAALHNMKRKGDISQNPNKHFFIPAAGEQEAEPAEAKGE